MAKKEFEAVAKLKLDSTDAKQDAKEFRKYLEQQLDGVEHAADHMNVFKKMTGLIAVMDQALSDLQAKHGDAFKTMFDGADADLTKLLEHIFGVTKESMAAWDNLKAKFAEIKLNGVTDGDDLKPFEQDVKSLYKAMGMLDKAGISGKGKIETRMAKLEAAINNFGPSVEAMSSKVKDALNFVTVGNQQDDILPYLKEKNTKIQEEIKKMQGVAAAYKEVLDILDGKQRSRKITDDNAIKVLEQLETKYLQAAAAAEKFKNEEGEASENYTKQAMQAIRHAALLKNTIDQFAEDNDEASKWAASDKYDNVEKYLEKMLGSSVAGDVAKYVQQQMLKVQTQITSLKTGQSDGVDQADKNKELTVSYDKLVTKVKEYMRLVAKLESEDTATNDDGDLLDDDGQLLDDKLNALREQMKTLGQTKEMAKQISNLMSDLQFGKIDEQSGLDALCSMLGVELPADIKAARTQMQEFLTLAKTYGDIDYMSEDSANASVKKLEEMKAELIELTNQGKLTIAEFEKFTAVFDSTVTHLRGMDHAGVGGQDPVKRWNEIVAEIDERGIESSSDADHYEGQLDEIKDQIDALYELGKVSDEVMKQVEANYEEIRGTIKSLRASETILNELGHLNNQATLTEDSAQLESIVQERKKLIAIAEEEEYWSNEVLEIQKAITAEIEKRINADKPSGDTTEVKDLEQQKKLLREIKNAYKKQYSIQDQYDNADDPDKFETNLEAAKDKVKEFEDQYHSVIVTLSDGMKIHLQFDDDDFIEDTEKLLKNAKKLQDIEFISKDVGSAIDAHTMLQSWKTLKDIGKDMRDFGASGQKEIRTKAIESLEEYIHRIDKFDPNFKYGSKEDYDRAIQFLETLKAIERESQMKKPLQDAADQFAKLNNLDLGDLRDAYNRVLEDVRNGTYTTVDECMAKFKELAAPVQTTKAYNDIFDVLSKISVKWKDLDTVDSAIGSMPLSDIDKYIGDLENLIKLIESVDPNFQHGDKTEYDGAVKMLEKMRALSERTKLTDEFENKIKEFKDLGKFEWSDDLRAGYDKILKDIKDGTTTTIGQCIAEFNKLSAEANKPVMDVSTAFRELVKHISNSHSSPATIFDHLEGTTLKVGDNLKEILEALNLIDSQGKVNLSSLKSGFTNLGGFVSDQYTMIARPGHYIGKIQSIQPKLQQAQKEGAQIGAIFDIIEDKAKNVIYEIQNTVPGKSVLGHHSNKTNPDVLNASAEHIEGLVNTLQILTKNGLFIDWGGDNILYDPQKGFSVIDMGDKGDKFFTVSSQNTMQENLDRMVKEMFKFSSLDMQQALKDGFVKNLYASAQKLDSAVVNPYAPKQTQTAKDAQAASTKTAAAVRKEEDAHENNAAAINAENEALKAQIELKKQAQSMKWEAFATDDSLSALKQAAGMQTLGQLEAFWKKSNYEKNVNFHEITEAEAKQIFKDKLSKGLASSWYGSADFSAKSKLENEILADDEIRNAALSYLYHLYKKMPVSQQDPAITDFQKFLDTEFTVYRGDKAPLIYDDQSKLSFSFKKSTAEGFNSQLGTAKIKPKDTIGNAGSGFYSEVETFINGYETSWYQKNREAFEDFYNKQTKEMQKEIDSGLVNFEKKRVSDILGDDLSTLTHKALKSAYWKNNVADDLNKGIIPDQITVPTDGSDYAQFADAYNGLSDTMKRFVMFFATMDELSASLPKQFSITTNDAYGFKYGKAAVGDGAKLFNAILNDPEGRSQHIAKLTGEQAFNLMGQTPADINAEADAHERNAKAKREEAKAQQTLNDAQDTYNNVQYELWDAAFDASGRKSSDLSSLWSAVFDVQHSGQDLVDQGMYKQKSTGDSVQATDLFQLVTDIEYKYNENLDYVKDYLKQVYANIDFGNIIQAQPQTSQADFESTKLQVYETAKNAYKSGNQKKYFKILGMLNHLDDIDVARPVDIANAEYEYNDSGRYYNISHLVEMVNRLEAVYHENFDYVYDYLKQVYGEATIDNALANISGDSSGRAPAPKYTELDYENVYSSAPADMQAAIDDLAVFQQRYEQLYALTNTQPIDIMFPGKPTLNEVDQVIAAFDEFKSKQRQIFQLQLLDYEGNKEKIQELQAEAVGLQNKLHDASLGENADISEYKLTYGFTDDQDADRFKKLVDMTESVHTVMNDLTRIGEYKMSLIPQEMQDMLDSDIGDAAERFMAQHAKQVQSAKAAAQQADASAAASKQQLQTEQDITAEKQRQAALTDQQAAQTPADAAQAQVAQTETTAMATLLQQVEAVKAAVIAKTDAFTAEGVAVEEAVNKEIAALTQLKTLLDSIQSSLQLIFAANNWSIGDVNVSQDKTSSNSMPNILGEIKSILGQIYGVLSKSTGVEADNKNSANYKAPVVDNKPTDSDVYKHLADKLPKDVATESTLSAILAAVNVLTKVPKDSGNADIANLSAALIASATELKSVASGIVQHQKAAKSDTSVANARISDKDSYAQIRDVALNALGNKALDSEVTEMKALANGVVRVTGWLKVAEDAWEGFTVQINEANEASKLAFSTNSKAAKQAAAQAKAMQETIGSDDDANIKLYDRAETEARAQAKIAEYTKQGEIATVQFKDSGRYTITILKKMGTLTKQIFQTFDENDVMIERTTATMSNATLAKIQELQRIAQYGSDKGLFGSNSGLELYHNFKKASDELDTMNLAFSQAGQLSDAQISKWDLQINLVRQLGQQIQKMVAYNQNPEINTKVNKNSYGATPLVNAQAKFNTLSIRAQDYVKGGWADVTDALSKYETALKELIAMQEKFGNIEPSNEQKIQFTQLKNACNQYGNELKKILDIADKFKDADAQVDVLSDIKVDDIKVRGQALENYVHEQYNGKATLGKFNADMTELQFTIKNTDGTVTNMTAAFNSAKTKIGSLRGETKRATTIFDALGAKFRELRNYAIARLGVDEFFQALRTGITYVRDIDSALTELKKVTDETDASYDRFLQNMSKTAGTVGSTVAELTTMAAEWARLGYNIEEASMLAESTAILLNVSEFSDATTASEALISTMQAFGYAADESQHVVDILNEVGFKMPRSYSNI